MSKNTINENQDFDPNQSLNYEASTKYLIEKSNRRAWTVAFISMIITFLSILALVFLIPLKTVEPYVIRVDKNGMTDIVSALNETTLTTDEAVDKHYSSEYVTKREAYYYELLEQDYFYVQLFSSNEVANNYRELYKGDNGRVEKLGANKKIEAKVLSVVLGESAGNKTATVRVELIKENLSSRIKEKAKIKVITITYDYFPDKEATEEERLKNPLGYKVLSYRVDNEVTYDD